MSKKRKKSFILRPELSGSVTPESRRPSCGAGEAVPSVLGLRQAVWQQEEPGTGELQCKTGQCHLPAEQCCWLPGSSVPLGCPGVGVGDPGGPSVAHSSSYSSVCCDTRAHTGSVAKKYGSYRGRRSSLPRCEGRWRALARWMPSTSHA